MVTYAVNIANVQEIATEMGTLSSYIQTVLEDLESAASQSLAGWYSAARDTYNVVKQVWDQAAADMAVQAGNAQRSLASIGDNYTLAEQQGTGLWGG